MPTFVTLVEAYNPEWPRWFDEVVAYVEPGLSGIPHTVEHVGSTAIPGMTGKPIIDLIVVPELGRLPDAAASLAQLGYVHQGNIGLPGREVFDLRRAAVANRLPSHHLYACEPDCYELRKHRVFRDFMRSNSNWIQRLSRLKWDLCVEHDNDRQAYMDGKDAMVKQITELGFQSFGRLSSAPPM